MGAVPGDGVSDRVAIQAAIDAAAATPDGGTVCLGAGRWTVDRAPVGSYDHSAALSTHGHHVTLRGVGPETVLELAGDQGAASTIVFAIEPGAEHLRVTGLHFDLSASTNTDEQTHAIATGSACAGATCLPIRDVLIDHVSYNHPRNTVTRKGDCVRLLGNTDATRVYGVRIIDNDFAECARSAIEIQRGVYDLVVTGNTFNAVKTCIDGEATGGPADIDARATITGNAFRPGCSSAISLTSYQGATIADNTMAGGITVYRSTQVAITGNAISQVATDATGTIDVENACDGLAIIGNTIIRTGSAGPVLKLAPHSGVACQHLTIANNTLTQTTPAWAIYMEAVSGAAIAGNHIALQAVTGMGGMAAIYNRAVMTAVPVTGLAITGNQITGLASYGVELHASPGTFGAGVVVSGNSAVGSAFGLCLSSAPGFTVPVTASGNAMGLGLYAASTVRAGD